MAGRILLIEDEPNIIEAIRFILSRDGWRVTTHSEGATAVDRIREDRPDAVILDVMLPGRSGFDILDDLRNDSATSALPVLLLTAKGQAADRARAESAGATLYMTKPFSNSEMLASVRAMVNGA